MKSHSLVMSRLFDLRKICTVSMILLYPGIDGSHKSCIISILQLSSCPSLLHLMFFLGLI